MARYVNCRRGLHNYSPVGGVGGGIARRTCFVCGNVQIDLGEVPVVTETDLFTETKLASIFEVEVFWPKWAMSRSKPHEPSVLHLPSGVVPPGQPDNRPPLSAACERLDRTLEACSRPVRACQ